MHELGCAFFMTVPGPGIPTIDQLNFTPGRCMADPGNARGKERTLFRHDDLS